MSVETLVDAVLLARKAPIVAPYAFPAPFLDCPETASLHYDPRSPEAWDKAGEEMDAGIGLFYFPKAVHVCAEIWRGEAADNAECFLASHYQAAVWAGDNPEDAAVIQLWAETLTTTFGLSGPPMLTVWAHIAGPAYASGVQAPETLALFAARHGYTPGPQFEQAVDMLAGALLSLAPPGVHEALQDWQDTLI